jgi:hypothetical protein
MVRTIGTRTAGTAVATSNAAASVCQPRLRDCRPSWHHKQLVIELRARLDEREEELAAAREASRKPDGRT